jgi:4-hydroxy-tetrahydrodipicolinate reductase
MIKIGLIGHTGRMGLEIQNVLKNHKNANFSLGCSSKLGSAEEVFKNSDIVIDFSSPEAFFKACDYAIKFSKPLVSGTTGFSGEQNSKISELSKQMLLVMSSNMSFGVNLFFKFARELSSALKNYPEYDAEIIETHHINKKDSPSGTAITLGKMVAEGRGQNFEDVKQYGRDLSDGLKKSGEIGFSSVRSGGIVGEHTLIFGSNDDRIELSHRACNRSIFAKGAVDLAVMIHNNKKPNGLYGYSDFL